MFEISLRMKDTKVMKAPAFDNGFEVIEPVVLLNLLPVLSSIPGDHYRHSWDVDSNPGNNLKALYPRSSAASR